MPQIAIPKPRPGRLVAIAFFAIALTYLLSFVIRFWLKFPMPAIAEIPQLAVCSGIACWLAFRNGKTDVTTWLIPLCLFFVIVTTAVAIPILLNGETTLMRYIIFWKVLLWTPLKILLLHWVGYSLLSSSFCFFLIRCDADSKLHHSMTKHKSGIRILFITTFVIAAVLVVERLIVKYSKVVNLESSTFDVFLMVTYPFNEVLLPFGIGYVMASRGRNIIGFVAIGIHALLALCLSVWSIMTEPFGGAPLSLLAQYYLYLLVARSLIIPAFLVSGYRFVIERRTPSASIGNEESFDSVLATENARQVIR
jgi:hypothetical protein